MADDGAAPFPGDQHPNDHHPGGTAAAAAGAGARPRRRPWGWIVAGIAAVTVAVLGFATASISSDRDRWRDEADRLEEKLELARGDAGAEIDALESERDGLEARAATAETELSAVSTDLDSVRAELDAVTGQLAAITDQLAAERTEVSRLTEELAAVGDSVVPMPDLLGLTLADAETFATEVGAVLLVEEVVPTNVIGRPGTIIEQHPAVDTTLVPGSVIWIQLFAVTE